MKPVDQTITNPSATLIATHRKSATLKEGDIICGRNRRRLHTPYFFLVA